MADFGLAAQIGRGNAMPGAQQQDPQNRMVQMMQLQQLQQNMMLARDQEARAAQLFPEQKRKLQVDIEGDQARTGVAIENREIARLQREEIQRQQRINRGLIRVMGMVDEGKLDLSTDAGFNQISDVELRMAARRQSAEIKEQNAKAEKAGYEANDVRRAQGYVFLDRTVPFIDGPATFNAALKKLLSVDPAAAEFVPNVYSPPNAQRLQEFVSTRRKSVQTIGGVPTLLNENTGVANELGIRNFGASTSSAGPNTISLPAGVQPPTRAQIGQFTPAEYGGVLATPQMGMDPARMAAGTPADVGAMQSGMPGQRLPVAGDANFAPAATPTQGGPIPASQFVAERQAAPKPLTVPQLTKLRNEIASDFKSVMSTIDQMNGVVSAAKEVTDLPEDTKKWISGWTGYLPSYQAETRTGDVKLKNLKGKVTELGRQTASLSGAIGSMAVQEWKIVSDMIANLDEKGMNPADLDRQVALIEAQAIGTANRIRDAYQRQYVEEFDRFGDRFKLPETKAPSAAAGRDGVDASNKWLR